MKTRLGVPGNRPLADFLPTITIKAKDFATEITIFNTKDKGLNTEGKISQEHITNNQSVRKILLERHIVPENLFLPSFQVQVKYFLLLAITSLVKSGTFTSTVPAWRPIRTACSSSDKTTFSVNDNTPPGLTTVAHLGGVSFLWGL